MSKNKYANIGGQAVMEGILMRSPKKSVMAVRTSDGEIVLEDMKFVSVRERFPILKLPILRGIASFVEGMFLGYKSLTRSAELAGLDEETSGSKGMQTFWMFIAVLLGVGIAVGLFIVLPVLAIYLLDSVVKLGFFKTLCEGVVRIIIFIVYILAVSKMKDIHTLFAYHGAEHKTIFCVEAGEELTVENVRKQGRLHPRCGTNFMFIVMIVSILFFSFVTWSNPIIRVLLKLALMPIVAGVCFEIIRFAGKYNNIVTKIISAPGKAMQKITTKEPTDEQIEVAISAIKASLAEDEQPIEEVDLKTAFSGDENF